MNQHWLECPVFICGYPKSGTTLLTSLLDNHPQLLNIPEETNVYKRILPEFKKFVPNASFDEKFDMLFNLITSYQLGRFNTAATSDSIAGNYDYSNIDFNLFKDSYKDFLNKNGFSDKYIIQGIAKAFYSASETYADKNDILKWVEKSTRNEKFTDLIIKDFPSAKCIHIIRDPRDNWVSYKKKHPGLKVYNFCKDWLHSYHLLKKNIEKYSANQYLVIKYENLVTEPEIQMKKIAEFLKLEYRDTLVQPSKNGIAWHGNSMWGNRNTQINDAALNRFSTWKPESDIVKIESILNDPILYFGYQTKRKNRLYLFNFTVFHTLKKLRNSLKS